MDFLTISADDRNHTLARALIGREQELFHYKLNIDNYTLILSTMPDGDWPDEILQYRGWDGTALAGLPAETIALVSEYAYRDRLRELLITENIEMGKSKRVYDAIKAQLPADQLDSLIANVQAAMVG